MYVMRKIVYEEIVIDRDELMSMADASRYLEMSQPGIIRALERGRLTEIIDKEREGMHLRRLVIKTEVEKMREDRILRGSLKAG